MKKLILLDEENLEMKPLLRCNKLLLLSLITNMILLTILLTSGQDRVVTKIIHTMQRDTIKIGSMPLTDSAITAELVKLGCVLPAVALAQFKLETGHFRSAICRENFNIAGIKTSRSKYVIGMNRDQDQVMIFPKAITMYRE